MEPKIVSVTAIWLNETNIPINLTKSHLVLQSLYLLTKALIYSKTDFVKSNIFFRFSDKFSTLIYL